MSRDNRPCAQWRLVNTLRDEQYKQLRLERASHTATVVDGSIYVVAGRRGSTFYSDLLRFDTTTFTWSVVFAAIPNGFRARANHTTTLVSGRQLWVVSGSDNENVVDDVHVFDVPTRTWSKPQLRGETSLLMRTAHSAELHPTDPRAILVFGGYGGSATAAFHNDLYVIRTHTLTVERVAVMAGSVPPPVPRGYHSCTAVGNRCYIYGGRTEAGVVDASEMLAVFDAATSCWMAPQVAGTWPQARSSHRAVALGNRLLIHGGAAAGEQKDRLADVHSLLVCPATGRLTWSKVDEPPAAGASGSSSSNPQGRAAHSIGLVGTDRLFLMLGYVGHGNGPQRYSSDVYMLLLGTPATRSPPPSPSRQRQPQGQVEQQQQQQRRLATPQAVRTRSPLRDGGVAGTPQAGTADGSASPAGGAVQPTPPKRRSPPPSPTPLPQSVAAAVAGAAARPGARRLPPAAAAGNPGADPAPAAATVEAATAAAVPAPTAASARDRRPGQPAARAGTIIGGVAAVAAAAAANVGEGADDDPIDLTLDQVPAASPVRAPSAVSHKGAQPQRARSGGTGTAPALAPAEGAWLGGGRRGNRVHGQLEAAATAAAAHKTTVATTTTAAAAAAAAAARGQPGAPGTGGLALGPTAATAAGAQVQMGDGADAAAGRPTKRQASDAAVAAAAAAAGIQLPPGFQRGIHPPQPAPQAQYAPPAVATAPVQCCQGGAPEVFARTAQTADLYGPVRQEPNVALPPVSAAPPAAAPLAAGGMHAGGGGGGGPSAYHRPPPPVHAVHSTPSQDALLLELFQRLKDEKEALLLQLQSAQEAERRANQQIAAQQEQQRRTEEEVSTQRRSCEMTQAALRTANRDLEEARAQLDQLHSELLAARQQAASAQQQQQLAATAQAAAQAAAAEAREQALLRERAAVAAAHQEELRKAHEQAKALETAIARQRAELDDSRREAREAREEGDRQRETSASLQERLRQREQEATELGGQLRLALSRNQEQLDALHRAQDAKQRLERELSEGREAQQRLARQLDEQVGDLSRQRDGLQAQLAHANNRLSGLEAELRTARDDVTHRDAQHAALARSHAEKVSALEALRQEHVATTQRAEGYRQQLNILQSHIANVVSSAQAAAGVVATALQQGGGNGPGGGGGPGGG